jgi:hypothetical protein
MPRAGHLAVADLILVEGAAPVGAAVGDGVEAAGVAVEEDIGPTDADPNRFASRQLVVVEDRHPFLQPSWRAVWATPTPLQ